MLRRKENAPSIRFGRVRFRRTLDMVVTLGYGTCAALLVCVLSVGRLHGTAPMDSVPPSFVNAVVQAMPQGWAFFTKSPKLVAWKVWAFDAGDGWHQLPVDHNNAATRFFGMDRSARTSGLQLAILHRAVDKQPSPWLPCTMRDVVRCLATAKTQPVQIVNPSPRPRFCGRLALQSYPPTPFEWRHLPNGGADTKLAILDVSCPTGQSS